MLEISFTTVTYLDKMSDFYESWEEPFLSRINNSNSEIQYSESGIQNSESGDCFPLSLFRGWLYHVIITYRLVAVAIEYKYEIIEDVILSGEASLRARYKRLFACLLDDVQRHFQQYVSYIVAVIFIRGSNRRTRIKPPTCHKSLNNFFT